MQTITAATLLASLAQPTRLEIFRALVVAGASGVAAGALAEQLGVSAPVLSFHLKALRFSELIDSEQRGRFVIYRARYDTMNALLAFLTDNCCAASPCADETNDVVSAPCCSPTSPPAPAQLAKSANRKAQGV
jgi:DNA-binding transcriptional ArsR family regulator